VAARSHAPDERTPAHRRHVAAATGGARFLASNLVDAEELEDCGYAAEAAPARNEERGAPVGRRRPRGGLANDCSTSALSGLHPQLHFPCVLPPLADALWGRSPRGAPGLRRCRGAPGLRRCRQQPVPPFGEEGASGAAPSSMVGYGMAEGVGGYRFGGSFRRERPRRRCRRSSAWRDQRRHLSRLDRSGVYAVNPSESSSGRIHWAGGLSIGQALFWCGKKLTQVSALLVMFLTSVPNLVDLWMEANKRLIKHKTTQQTCSTLLAVYIQPPMERFFSMLHNAFQHLPVVHNMSAEPVKNIQAHTECILSACVNH
jgi:hypothetical protein